MFYTNLFSVVFILSVYQHLCYAQNDEDSSDTLERFKIEGTVVRPQGSQVSDSEWFSSVRIYTNTGFSAFLRSNGSFVMHNLPWGSHYLYVSHPTTAYRPLKIDINSKGKWRVRKIFLLQPSKLDAIAGPLKFSPEGQIRYFQPREQWRLTDMLFSPMVLMTVLPLLFLLVVPKLNDPEARKEMEAAQLQMETPELSEMIAKFLGGGSSSNGVTDKKSVQQRPPVGGANAPRGNRRKDK